MSELTKTDIANNLKGIERYNPQHLPILIEYLNAQCANNQYDLEANSAILKLYQFNPTIFKAEVVEKILLKALTNLPHPDYILCELLIESSKLSEGRINDIVLMYKRLELCEFKAFWAELENQEDLIKDVVGFKDSIRNFVCHIVGITYQHIRSTQLQGLLGLNNDSEAYKALLKKRNWEPKEDGFVLVANQEDKIKTINITEKIELEQVANILAQYG